MNDCLVHYSLFIIHYSLFIIHYSLFIIHYSLFIIHYSLFIIHYSLFIIHYSLFYSLVTVPVMYPYGSSVAMKISFWLSMPNCSRLNGM
ncbi:hypothetical protein EXU85_15925 [Spirosoma sp. KCTC 42546]|nr:hypothetical protein EXU85_15925 [Spirosoma sp. KCTC 42546]